MQPAVLIRLRPLGPWRYGAGEGGRDRTDKIFRSDRLYSAVTGAMRHFGWLDGWLAATARTQTAQVAFSSLFPFQGDVLFVSPPRTLWPPPARLVSSPSPVFLSKMRWNAAQFVPVSVVDSMLTGRPILADQWSPDPESGCLLRRDRPSTTPFRNVMRTRVAIDRVSRRGAHSDSFACVEFEPGAGLWSVARFADGSAADLWSDRVTAVFRLLADTGFGGGRTIGWGQTAQPEFQTGTWPNLLFPRTGKLASRNFDGATPAAYWLLSLYSPAETDSPDWSNGDYELAARGGHTQTNSVKQSVQMIAEGSVIVAANEPAGTAVDVAPEGHGHPIYRAGFAVSLRLPELTEEDIKPVEEPTDEEAPEAKPCPREQAPEAEMPETAEPQEPGEVAPEPQAEQPPPAHADDVVQESLTEEDAGDL